MNEGKQIASSSNEILFTSTHKPYCLQKIGVIEYVHLQSVKKKGNRQDMLLTGRSEVQF